MADINTATLIGRLTRDEELKYTPGGMAIGNISVAINRKVKKGQEWVDESNFFDVVIFGKQAENLKQYLTKGKQIGITGFLKQERWKDQNGQSRSAVKIYAEDIQLLGGRDGNESLAPNGNANNAPSYDDSEEINY